jgi:RNA polymerase sigma factor (TIGR02999 family)
MNSGQSGVTELLLDWRKGDKAALDRLIPVVYQELRKLARKYLGNERPSATLQPTALIHEAYIRLLGQEMPEWKNRAHFYGVAAHLMREILVDHARRHRAEKRGGKNQMVPLDEAAVFSTERFDEFLNLDRALQELATFDARKCKVLELHYFGGLSQEEAAEVLGVSERTVRRDLRLAQAWLQKELVSR